MSGDDRPTARQLILSLPHEAALGREDFVVSPVNAAAIGTILLAIYLPMFDMISAMN